MKCVHSYGLKNGVAVCEKCGDSSRCPPHHYILGSDCFGICKYCGAKKQFESYPTAMKMPKSN